MLLKVFFPIFIILLQTTAQNLLKAGVMKPAINFIIPFNPFTLTSYVCVAVSFLCWIFYLRVEQLTFATAVTSSVYITIPLVAYFFLGEKLTTGMLLGFALIFSGILCVALNS